jgi:hypothetical protein
MRAVCCRAAERLWAAFRVRGVFVAEGIPCSGEDVFAELPGCLNLARRYEHSSEMVRGINCTSRATESWTPGGGCLSL